MHCHFLRPGDDSIDIVYHVERLSDGRSFASRQVRAKQNGKLVFCASVSCHDAARESRRQHSISIPSSVAPEHLPDDRWRLRCMLSDPRLPPDLRPWLQAQLKSLAPMDVRYARDSDLLMPQPESACQLLWVQPRGRIAGAGVPPRTAAFLHQLVAALASDFAMLATAALPHTWPSPSISMMASLDHVIWFHEPFSPEEWLLHEVSSPRLVDGRGLAFGRMFTRTGACVASTAQEGLIRWLGGSEGDGGDLREVSWPAATLSSFDSEGLPVAGNVARVLHATTVPLWQPEQSSIRPRRQAAQQPAAAQCQHASARPAGGFGGPARYADVLVGTIGAQPAPDAKL